MPRAAASNRCRAMKAKATMKAKAKAVSKCCKLAKRRVSSASPAKHSRVKHVKGVDNRIPSVTDVFRVKRELFKHFRFSEQVCAFEATPGSRSSRTCQAELGTCRYRRKRIGTTFWWIGSTAGAAQPIQGKWRPKGGIFETKN